MLNRRCANEYNSLADVHLQAYFTNKHLLRHLRQAGLINKKREIVPESTYRANINRAEQKREVKEALAQAIVHKSLDLQLKRESEIQKRLEEIAKLEMVKKMRSERQLRKPPMTPSSRTASRQHPAWKYFTVYPSKQDSFPASRPRTAHTRQNVRDSISVTSGESGSYIDSYSDSTTTSVPESDTQIRHARGDPGSRGFQRKQGRFPSKKHGSHIKKDEREELKTSPYLDAVPSTEKRLLKIPDLPSGARKTYHPPDSMVNKRTNCLVTLMFLGTNTYVSWDEPNPGTEVVIHQQHCGGNTLCVYRNHHIAREEFSFVSHRHLNFPFSLSIYLSGILYLRVSACCEYRHRKGTRLGGPQGLFSLINVQGASPCARCLINRKMYEEKKKLRINSSKVFEDGIKVEPPVSTCLIKETESIQEKNEESEKENNEEETEDKDDLTQSEQKEAEHEPIQFTVSGTVINVEDSNSEEEDDNSDYQEDFEEEVEQIKDGEESDDKEQEVEEVVEITEVDDISDETSSSESEEEVPSEKEAEEVEEETEVRKEDEALEVVEIKDAVDSDSDETSSTKSGGKAPSLEDDDYEDDFHKDDEAEEKNKEAADTETETNDQNHTLESSSLDRVEKEKDNELTNPEDNAENVEEKKDKESVEDLKNEKKDQDINSMPAQENTHEESDSDGRSESSSSKESSNSSAPLPTYRKKSKVKPERRIRANNRKTVAPGSSSSDSESIAHLPAELEGTEKAKNWIPASEQQRI